MMQLQQPLERYKSQSETQPLQYGQITTHKCFGERYKMLTSKGNPYHSVMELIDEYLLTCTLL